MRGPGLGAAGGTCMAPTGARLNFAKRRAPGRGVHNFDRKDPVRRRRSAGAQRPGSTRGLTGRTVLLMFSAQVVRSSDRKLSWACRHPLAGGWSPMLLRLLSGQPGYMAGVLEGKRGVQDRSAPDPRRLSRRGEVGGGPGRDDRPDDPAQGAPSAARYGPWKISVGRCDGSFMPAESNSLPLGSSRWNVSGSRVNAVTTREEQHVALLHPAKLTRELPLGVLVVARIEGLRGCPAPGLRDYGLRGLDLQRRPAEIDGVWVQGLGHETDVQLLSIP
jgi:hypothetical protein